MGGHANICRSVFESDVMGYVGEMELLRSGGGSVLFFFLRYNEMGFLSPGKSACIEMQNEALCERTEE